MSEALSLSAIRQMAEHMPSGFFIYHAGEKEDFLLVNAAMLRMAKCESPEAFKELTGNSFRGFVHPEDIERVETENDRRVKNDSFENDFVEYRICCRDGSKKWIRSYAHFAHTDCDGDVFYVFAYDATEEHSHNVSHKVCQEANIPSSMCQRKTVKNESAKKSILVVEDSELNREILEELLKDEFRILTAENGEEGIRLLKENRDRLSLVLLDVYMPVCNGFEFLEQTQRDPFLASVPVIVATGSEKHEDEERCLQLGATDFITKPYNLETMLGRIHNVIRLHETISELSVVEFDKLTGLYAMPAFLHHADQQLRESDAEFDLGILSVLDFSAINRIYGERKGDEVLEYFGDILRQNLPNVLLARQGNNFYALHPSGQGEIFQSIRAYQNEIEINGPVANLRTRLGLYRNVDKQQPVSVLCDRAKLAIMAQNNSSWNTMCYYDASMEKKQLEEKKLITEFDSAIENHEFVIWIQPKVNISSQIIVAGEVLVRWIDKEGNFISPGTFIPLYEKEGKIQQLDEYVFRAVCVYQRERKEAGGRMIPISINLSRNSLFRRGIVDRYLQIATEEQADLSLIPLEITESAATTEKQIKEICDRFIEAGFVLQMDDFGTGYSSLSALATLPFSVIKLDKTLIDQIGSDKGNIVIKNIVETAHELGMKVVAEGVEEKTQVEFLARVECDQIQGYYYSPPKKISLFEELMAMEEPFSDMGTIENVHSDSIISLASADLNRFLRVCKRIFAAARLLEADCCSYCMAKGDGTLDVLQEPCFAIWERSERCANCISLKAMQTKKTEHKFEVFENEVYSVYSVYMEVDGRPHVLELLSTVGTGMLHGYKDNISLIDLMQTDNIDLFLDIQLGTLNRRFFEERKDSLKNISALAMIDIDNFKEINDQYGHLVGDRVLVEVAQAIKHEIRETDFLIRMGGDELMIGFTGMKSHRLQAKLEDIRDAVAGIRIIGNERIHSTISIGATTCQGYSEEVYERADQALYEGKRTKNMVVVR